jgi:hypothetical protein
MFQADRRERLHVPSLRPLNGDVEAVEKVLSENRPCTPEEIGFSGSSTIDDQGIGKGRVTRENSVI